MCSLWATGDWPRWARDTPWLPLFLPWKTSLGCILVKAGFGSGEFSSKHFYFNIQSNSDKCHVAVCKAIILCDINNHFCAQVSLTAGTIYFWEESTFLSQVLQLHARQLVLCDVLFICTGEGDQINVRPVGKEEAAPAWPGGVTPWSQTCCLCKWDCCWVRHGKKFNFIFEAVM